MPKDNRIIVTLKPTKNQLPDVGSAVLAIVQHCTTKKRKYVVLRYVDEDDCSWRVDDIRYMAKLAHDWDVIAWGYLPEGKEGGRCRNGTIDLNQG